MAIFNTHAIYERDGNGKDKGLLSVAKNILAGSWFGGSNVGDLSSRTSLDIVIPANKVGYKCFIMVVHRTYISMPSDWTYVDKRINKSGWQWISVFSKVITEAETATITSAANNTLVADTFYTDADKILVYDGEYWGNASTNPMQWVIPKATYPRVFAVSIGYGTSSTSTSISYTPSLNGWQTPSSFSQATIRAFIFYMTGAENSQIIVKYNGMYAGGNQDVGNSSHMLSYMIASEIQDK